MLLRRPDGGGVVAIISICGEREYRVEAKVAHRLDLCFDDVSAPDPNNIESVIRARSRAKFAALNGRVERPPTVEDAQAVVEFARSVRDVDGVVLCHCGAGVSRSTAAALVCLATWTRPGEERYCVEELVRVRPCAAPHADLVRFGDEVLARSGALTLALREYRRSAWDFA